MESKENKKAVSLSSHSPWKSRKERGITTFPPHGDYYWIWTILLCSRPVNSTLHQQRCGFHLEPLFQAHNAAFLIAIYKVSLRRRPQRVEVQCCLFVALWMLLSPQDQEQRGHFGHDRFRPMNLRVTARAERDHQTKYRLPWYPVMNNDRALVSTRRITDTAAVPIALQYRFAQAAKILFILSLEGVAGRA